jgi:2-phosphosulfolactate phosphatase
VDDAQQKYQVRFDWGHGGYRSLAAGADVVILADSLPPASDGGGTSAGGTGSETSDDVRAGWLQRLHAESGSAGTVIVAGLNNRRAVAEWVLERQAEKGGRFSVAVIGAGESRPDGSDRWAVEDLLAAGAVIDALTDVGIDHCSPEAAAASAAFVGLKQAVKHLVSASESGQALAAAGRKDAVIAASLLDVSGEVVVIRELNPLP